MKRYVNGYCKMLIILLRKGDLADQTMRGFLLEYHLFTSSRSSSEKSDMRFSLVCTTPGTGTSNVSRAQLFVCYGNKVNLQGPSWAFRNQNITSIFNVKALLQ
ncbi:hypothetical protein ATANTOWER_032334 [Ataeniobius toweri]|uniref:Uncharacterized protein n=1 Tax=Ataeniobius toweri TaxID=208326 RepID=A0ABU7CAY9_9TELE|nr:hypothetical protein [Ataeniobius toweri]